MIDGAIARKAAPLFVTDGLIRELGDEGHAGRRKVLLRVDKKPANPGKMVLEVENLNVNADDAALGIAQVLAAQMLVLLTDVPGILDGSGDLIKGLVSRFMYDDMIVRFKYDVDKV